MLQSRYKGMCSSLLEQQYESWKKDCFGYWISKKKKKEKDDIVPMYNHYAVGFSNCDKYNRVLHEKFGQTGSRETRGSIQTTFLPVSLLIAIICGLILDLKMKTGAKFHG